MYHGAGDVTVLKADIIAVMSIESCQLQSLWWKSHRDK